MAEINSLDPFKNPNHKPSLQQPNGALEFTEAVKDQHFFQHNIASRQQHHQQH